jgi:hypothetical protein
MDFCMTVHRVLSTLLVLAWLAVDAALLDTLMRQGTAWPQGLAACATGLVFGQAAVICVWLVWSPANPAVRVGGASAAFCLFSLLAAVSTGDVEARGKWLTVLSVYGGLIVLPLAAARLRGLHIRAPDVTRVSTVRRRRARQFTIAGLLTCTTCVAVLLGVWRWSAVPGKAVACIVGFCSAAALASLVALLLAGFCRAWLPIVLALGALCPLFGALLARTGVPPADLLPLVLMTSAQYVSIAGSLAVLRIAGYRPVDRGGEGSPWQAAVGRGQTC